MEQYAWQQMKQEVQCGMNEIIMHEQDIMGTFLSCSGLSREKEGIKDIDDHKKSQVVIARVVNKGNLVYVGYCI